MDVTQIASNVTGVTGASRSAANLSSDDFFKLLIAQLTNQDPMEPTSNQELLQQISSIRDIELSTTLTESLQRLAGQQQFGSASTLIGQYVTGVAGSDGKVPAGTVVAVKFDSQGLPTLQLSSGVELKMSQLASIVSPVQAAESMVGRLVTGLDRRNPAEPEVIEGLVTAVRVAEGGEVFLELDSGDDIRLRDVVATK
ncbi:MAG: hypothetical protein IIC02_02590 [Planctomycetes bacterium]|nr:hypothetical protein [Planctomycetota bacterium]